MTTGYVPPQRTPMSVDEAIDVFASAYRTLFSRKPSAETLAILVAQCALETGNWKSCWNHNQGNIRGTFFGAWTSFKAGEIIDGKEVILEPGANNKFRAYPSAIEGVQDYMRFLGIDTTPDNGKPNRYEKAWAAAEAGDLRAFVFALHAAGYFTADPKRYYDGADGPGGRPGILALYEQFLPRCRQHLGISDSEPPATDPAPPKDDMLAQARKHFAAAGEELRLGREALDKLEEG